jgi:hypothetical protein
MSTTPAPAHSYTTVESLAAALHAAVTRGQIANIVADATRPALVATAKSLNAYDGHSRDTRDKLEAVVVNAYIAARTTLADTDDTPPVDDTATAIVSLVDRSRTAHNTDATRCTTTPDEPIYDTGDAPAPAPRRTTGGPRANAARTFVSAEHDTYTCVGHCGRTMAVTAFFPLTKGGAFRSEECSRCIDERRAIVNPTSALAVRTLAALDRRMARPNPDPAPVGYVAPTPPVDAEPAIVPGRDTV